MTTNRYGQTPTNNTNDAVFEKNTAINNHQIIKVAAIDNQTYADQDALNTAYNGQVTANTALAVNSLNAIYELKSDGSSTLLTNYFNGLTVNNNSDNKFVKWNPTTTLWENAIYEEPKVGHWLKGFVMTSDVGPFLKVFQNSVYPHDYYKAFRAMDGQAHMATAANTDSGGVFYWEISFYEAKRFHAVTFTGRMAGQYPTDMTIQVENDGVWTDVKTLTGLTFEGITTDITPTVGHTLRLNVTASINNAANSGINNFNVKVSSV